MKFFCEYCGARIDAEVDNNCPKCGASYKKNKTFIELENTKKQEIEKISNFQNEIRQQVVGRMKFSKVFLIFPIIIFIAIAAIVIVGFTNAKTSRNELNIGSIKEKAVTVGLNEFGSTSKYKAKVVKYETTSSKYGFNKLKDDQEFVKFYLVVENISGEQLTRENVNCIVNGIVQTNEISSGYSDLPFLISTGLTVQGTSTFAVPIDATSYDIRYGDYITIHIEK